MAHQDEPQCDERRRTQAPEWGEADAEAIPFRNDVARFSITPDGRALVEVAGEIDLASAHCLDHALSAARCAGATAIVIDLRGTTFMDVRGLRAILVAAEEAYVRGRPIELRGAPPSVNRMLDVLEMSWLFDRADDDGPQQN